MSFMVMEIATYPHGSLGAALSTSPSAAVGCASARCWKSTSRFGAARTHTWPGGFGSAVRNGTSEAGTLHLKKSSGALKIRASASLILV